MNAAMSRDREAIARACERFGVARLRVFGSAVTGRFDPDRSDVDFFVDFLPEVHDLLGNYLALNDALEQIVGRKVDLVMSDAVENPYFAAEAFGTAQDVFAASRKRRIGTLRLAIVSVVRLLWRGGDDWVIQVDFSRQQRAGGGSVHGAGRSATVVPQP